MSQETALENQLLSRIQNRQAKVGVVGLGYVGLPLALTFAEKGFPVFGFDVDPAKTEALDQGRSYLKHIASDRVAAVKPRLSATTDFAKARDCDALITCVPTPLNHSREPDLSYVSNTARSLSPHVRRGQLYVLESTSYPGTTDEIFRPELERTGLRAGVDFHLAFSPEREDPGNPKFSTATIPKVVGGLTPACLEVAQSLYAAIVTRVVPVSSMAAAEMTKLMENIYRSVNIALVNELKTVCDRMGLDIWEVVEAASTKPFGFQLFYPGPGLGGHCIPVDPFYLTWKARQFDVNTRFIELAGEINTSMPMYVVQRLSEALNEDGKAIKNSKILVLGLAYKRDVDDVRESPSFKVIELLEDRGARVAYHDPHVPQTHKMRHHDLKMTSTPLTVENLAAMDAVVILTDHTAVDYQALGEHARLVVDSRNAMRKVRGRARVVRA
jgi:UDP-N-acetyl-D-glucosamine dehydrogenase